METKAKNKEWRLCDNCLKPYVMTDMDKQHNLARQREQSFRPKGQIFTFRFRVHCPNCGEVYIDRLLRRV